MYPLSLVSVRMSFVNAEEDIQRGKAALAKAVGSDSSSTSMARFALSFRGLSTFDGRVIPRLQSSFVTPCPPLPCIVGHSAQL